MMLIGLLLVALACIVLGIVFASGPWFIGSLVASGVAAYLLWRQRDQISGRGGAKNTGAERPATASRQTALVTGTAFAGTTDDPAEPPAAEGAGRAVWVVDGQPEYHRADCARIADADHEPVPLAQAIGDGFIACLVCKPDEEGVGVGTDTSESVASASATEAASASASASSSVSGAGSGGGHHPSPDPDDAAAADPGDAGGAPDSALEAAPDSATASAAGPAPGVAPGVAPDLAAERTPAAPGDVWVVDGRPRYHLADCLIIKGQPAEPIPLDQATEDGFMPCTMCEPNVTRV